MSQNPQGNPPKKVWYVREIDWHATTDDPQRNKEVTALCGQTLRAREASDDPQKRVLVGISCTCFERLTDGPDKADQPAAA